MGRKELGKLIECGNPGSWDDIKRLWLERKRSILNKNETDL